MSALSNKNVVVIGGSRGVGRTIVTTMHGEGARVLAVARQLEALDALARELPGVSVLSFDAADGEAPAAVFAKLQPDVLVICGGAKRTGAPLQELAWDDFAGNWNTDVKASFHFCKEALLRPLAPGSTVVLISSGAAIGGSPMSGGYAGAKRTQMFMADYAQRESDRLRCGVRFVALAPSRPMLETEGGKAAVHAYANYLGVSPAEFVQRLGPAQTAMDVASAVIEIAAEPGARKGNAFMVSAQGLEAVP